ncbi:MAG TPA: sulfotransferase [Pyrinomonadaceae bacterium]|nr:sulfotransferase [Pyrinomonadaceae bacterium]
MADLSRHLLHIGYPKTGSTFLQEWFKRHPQLCYVPGALGGFRSVYEIARPARKSYEYYVTSCEALSMANKSLGDFMVSFGKVRMPVRIDWMEEWLTKNPDRIKKDQAEACTILKTLYPGSRVIIVTRGFKESIISLYSSYVRTGGSQHLNRLCREAADCLTQYFDYDHLIQLYGNAFGESNLTILPYELLRDDQQKFLSILENKLSLEPVDIKLGRLNPSLLPAELYWYPAISRVVAAAGRRLGTAQSQRIYLWYVSKTLENRLRPLIRILERWRPDRRTTEADFPVEILSNFKGKATRLKDDPLYVSYAAEYLWDS